jgi:hypothetical protein
MRVLAYLSVAILLCCRGDIPSTEAQGPTVQQDNIAAMRNAAENGDLETQCRLAATYYLGLGVPQNYVEAYFWYDLAASGEIGPARREAIDELRADAAKHLTPADLDRAQDRAQKWFETHSTPSSANLAPVQPSAGGGSATSTKTLDEDWDQRLTAPSIPSPTNDSLSDSPDVSSSVPVLGNQADPRERTQTRPGCKVNISFAVATGTDVVRLAPTFTEKWISKNHKKYPGLCFSQTPVAQTADYLVVFSNSQSALSGLEPSLQTTSSTTTTPIYGSGSVTSNTGGTWNYTYSGSATSYTTSTTQVNLPYTLTTDSIYENAYNQTGVLISQRYRSFTTQRGGDPYSALGTNIGALIRRAHIKENLLKDAVTDIEVQPR